MKHLILLFFLLSLIACSNVKKVYWCGDHACINKKEKEAYFKKTMIVEIRELNKKNEKSKSEIDKIKKQAGLLLEKEIQAEKDLVKNTRLEKKRIIKEQKELVKQARLEKKRRIKMEKELARQALLEEKRRIKEEKELAKQVRLEEKERIKNEKKLAKQVRLEEKKRFNEEKRLAKQARLEEKNSTRDIWKKEKKSSKKKVLKTEEVSLKKETVINTNLAKVKPSSDEFQNLVEKITRKNMLRPYPNINNLPN